MSVTTKQGDRLLLPGIASAHSHAFQRALRGRTHRRGDFWSWRGLMYDFAEKLTPESIYDISLLAYVELAKAGVTAVGEFHYVHHQAHGEPYENRTELAEAVIRAARDAGIRITLLRVIYERAGAGKPPESAQRRFADANLDAALQDVEALLQKTQNDAHVRVGIAPHSVRAVRKESIAACSQLAKAHGLPLHMHISEQRKEIQECLAEHQRRPVELLAEMNVLNPQFIGVHATHLTQEEVRLLGNAKAFACVCRTTERDLGDGLPPLQPMLAHGVRLCFGVDSHAQSDPFEEARAAELDERSRLEKRVSAAEADLLLDASTVQGYAAIGFPIEATQDRIFLDANNIALVGSHETTLDDTVVFAARPDAVVDVHVSNAQIVSNGHHPLEEQARNNYIKCLKQMGFL